MSDIEINIGLNLLYQQSGSLDSNHEVITELKKSIISKSKIFQIIDEKVDINKIAGFKNLKNWFKARALILKNIENAEKYGIRQRKNLCILG